MGGHQSPLRRNAYRFALRGCKSLATQCLRVTHLAHGLASVRGGETQIEAAACGTPFATEAGMIRFRESHLIVVASLAVGCVQPLGDADEVQKTTVSDYGMIQITRSAESAFTPQDTETSDSIPVTQTTTWGYGSVSVSTQARIVDVTSRPLYVRVESDAFTRAHALVVEFRTGADQPWQLLDGPRPSYSMYQVITIQAQRGQYFGIQAYDTGERDARSRKNEALKTATQIRVTPLVYDTPWGTGLAGNFTSRIVFAYVDPCGTNGERACYLKQRDWDSFCSVDSFEEGCVTFCIDDSHERDGECAVDTSSAVTALRGLDLTGLAAEITPEGGTPRNVGCSVKFENAIAINFTTSETSVAGRVFCTSGGQSFSLQNNAFEIRGAFRSNGSVQLLASDLATTFTYEAQSGVLTIKYGNQTLEIQNVRRGATGE